jgi:hypothetical protein
MKKADGVPLSRGAIRSALSARINFEPMARMLGSSRTLGYSACTCRLCMWRDKPGVKSRHRRLKRIARGREAQLWKREQA